MRQIRLLSSGRPNDDDSGDKPGPDDPVTRGLRDLYAAPSEGYWDSLEARVMAAVRAGRSAPTAVADWWHTLAAWARPGLAAAGVVLGIVGAAALQSRDSWSTARADLPPSALEPLDADLARALDLVEPGAEGTQAARDARAAADLLIDGVYRRPVLPLPERTRAHEPRVNEDGRDEVLRARREATFRYVMP